jgi:hypothetical protein
MISFQQKGFLLSPKTIWKVGNIFLAVQISPIGLSKRHEEHHFSYTVTVKNGKKTFQKDFKITLGTFSKKDWYLFSVPKDFLWVRKGNMEVTVSNISHDSDRIFQYYHTIRIYLRRPFASSLFMWKD